MRPALTDQQIARIAYRIELFKLRGLSEHDAEITADRLADRDYERDNRRMCVECKHLTATATCLQGGPVLKTVLQRCEYFDWNRPSAS